MKRKSIRDIVVFYLSDLPAPKHPEHGFSIHRGVLIQWDGDMDARITAFVNQLPPGIRRRLLIAQESRGMLSLVWDGLAPEGFRPNDEVDVGDDIWTVMDSVSCLDFPEPVPEAIT